MAETTGYVEGSNSVLSMFNNFLTTVNTQASSTIDVIKKWNEAKVANNPPATVPSGINDTVSQTANAQVAKIAMYIGVIMMATAGGIYLYKKL